MSKQDNLLLTPVEYDLAIIDYMRQHGGVTSTDSLTKKEMFEIATKAQLAKAIPIIEARKDAEWQKKLEEAVKKERERIIYNF